MIAPPKATKPPDIKRKSVKNFLQGTVTAYDDGRTPIDGLRSSGNVLLEQDGTVRPRPSLNKYGPQPTGTILGEIFEFTKKVASSPTNLVGQEKWLATLQNVGGTTKVYVARGEDTSWTVCEGKTYNNTARARFCQTQDKVLVLNGEDNLSYLDTNNFNVVPFTSLSTPAAPTLDSKTGLTGTSFKIYYAITYNSTVGETDGSTILTQSIGKDRDIWDPAADSMTIKRSATANIKSWNVYVGMSADSAGIPTMYLIASGLDASTLTFTDNGTRAQDLLRSLPTTNSTAGPKAAVGTVINGRVWLCQDKDNLYKVWRGGDYGYELDFSPANGGGSTPIGNGTKELPVKVMPFRDGRGVFQITVLCQGTNGHGKRYILTPNSATYGSTTFTFYEVTEDNGQDGTDSPDGVILYNDSLWYPSRDGFKTTGTKPQLQNILSTDRISNTIQPDIKTLNNAYMSLSVGLAFEGRLYWALPVGSNKNNEIWVLDIDRKGAWMKPWNVSADWMTLYNDNSGTTHFLVLSNNKIYEFSYVSSTADDGVAFPTSGNSGQITFSDDGREWGKLIQLVFILLRPQGQVNFSVSGRTEDSALSTVGKGEFAPKNTRAGWSEPRAGWSSLRGWSEIVTVPVAFNDATQEVVVDVDEDLQWYSYGWNSVDAGVDYNLADVIAVYVPIGIKNL